MKIYTKTGDKGETSLLGGRRVSKSDLRIEVLGEIDELNSAIGMAVSEIQNLKGKSQNYNSKVKNELIAVQKNLFEIGSFLAGNTTIRYPSASLRAGTLNAKRLEETIDEIQKDLPELKNFILPGGGKAGSFLHFARSIARRAERKLVSLRDKREEIRDKNSFEEVIAYFNRLSDLIFVMARYINYKENKKEIILG